MAKFVNHCKHCGQDFIDWIQGETMCEDCADAKLIGLDEVIDYRPEF